MKAKVSVLTLVVASVATNLVACTPKPPSAQPIVEEFFEHIQARDFAAAGALTDQAATVENVLQTSFDGLQAEGVSIDLQSVQAQDTIATANYELHWQLPRERSVDVQSSLTLNKINDKWLIRWQPSALHPRLGANQHLELRQVPAKKASVVSSDGAEIMTPGSVYRILVDTSAMDGADYTARMIAQELQAAHKRDENVRSIESKELREALENAEGKYAVTTVSMQEGAEMRKILDEVPGVIFNEEAAMITVDPGFAPDIMSRINNLVTQDLDGQPGWRIAAVTPDGAALEDLEYHEAKVAPSVRVGLDYNIQRAAEIAVNTRPEMQAVLVAIRPSNGDILAVAQTDKADADGDIGLQGLYPPGSTFKILTAAAGMEYQHLTPDSTVPCPGSMNIYGRIVNNYNQFSLGNTSLERAFARSCNTTFADISTKLNQGELQHVAADFGLGIDYQIPGLNTITGQVPIGETALEKTEAGYGQGTVLVSPFGMALVSATAASGKTPTPKIVSGHETVINGEAGELRPETIEQLRRLMRSVTAPGGTAGGMQAEGEIFAKTGEAEFNGGSHAWFTGYRTDDIAFATLVVRGGGSEHSVAITDKFFVTLDQLRAGGDIPN